MGSRNLTKNDTLKVEDPLPRGTPIPIKEHAAGGVWFLVSTLNRVYIYFN